MHGGENPRPVFELRIMTVFRIITGSVRASASEFVLFLPRPLGPNWI